MKTEPPYIELANEAEEEEKPTENVEDKKPTCIYKIHAEFINLRNLLLSIISILCYLWVLKPCNL